MKTSELEGRQLDYWVAKAEGAKIDTKVWPHPLLCHFEDCWDRFPKMQDSTDDYEPSTDWAHGGPIIEREKLELLFSDSVWRSGNGEDADGDWKVVGYGSTALIAAMRAYVASKFGDTVLDEVAV